MIKKIEFPEFLDVKEVANIFGVSVRQIYREIEDGSLKAIMVRKKYKIFAEEVNNYIARNTYIGYDNVNKREDIRTKRKYSMSK